MTQSRSFRAIEDHQRISDFLEDVYRINQNQMNWLSSRWQYMAYFIKPLYLWRGYSNLEEMIRIWETEDQRIVGVVSPESPKDVFLQVHPDYRFLENEMIAWAEDHLSHVNDENKRRVKIWVHDKNEPLQEILQKRGFLKREDVEEHFRWQNLDGDIPEPILPKGYRLLSLAEGIRCEDKCDTVVKAFGSSGLPIEIYQEMQTASLYRPELDIVSVDEGGTVASFCTIWYDPKNGTATYEPVGTHPDHQRKGLGAAVIYEGLKRLKALGARVAFVQSYSNATDAFYHSVGFTQFDCGYAWIKESL
jgi:GNAT superfamily N-acetyltransferase